MEREREKDRRMRDRQRWGDTKIEILRERQRTREIDGIKQNKTEKRRRKSKRDKENERDGERETERALSVYCRRHKM